MFLTSKQWRKNRITPFREYLHIQGCLHASLHVRTENTLELIRNPAENRSRIARENRRAEISRHEITFVQ
jgi:hypothetical protein